MRRTFPVLAGLLAGISACPPCPAHAQAWTLDAGVVGRGEYNDNYLFTAVDRQSAFTTTLTPLVTASRHTETSDIAAVAGVGGNWVSGSTSADYLSGLAGVNGSLRDARSTWGGNISFVRSAALQSEADLTGGVVLGLAYTNAASATGTYSYALTERWSLGATVSGYNNRYESVAGNNNFQNNHGYYAGGTATYAYTDATQIVAAAGFSNYSSDLSRSDSATATLGIVYRFSPQLLISASGGGFWSDTTAEQGILVGESRRATGGLWGGQISYSFSDDTQLVASAAENLSPSGTGVLSKVDNAGVTLTSRFSDRLTGRLGGSFSRTIYPQAQTSALNYDNWQAEVGVTYRLAERWSLDAGYRYTRTSYDQSSSATSSNVSFVSIGYNWPGTSFTNWVGRVADVPGTPGAGPVPPSEGTRPTSGPPGTPDNSVFDPFVIP